MTGQIKNVTFARIRTQDLGFWRRRSCRLFYGASWQFPNFNPFKLQISNSFRRFLSRVESIFIDMLFNNISLMSTVDYIIDILVLFFISMSLFASIFYCANPCRNWTFQRFARIAQKNEHDTTNKNCDTR